MTKILSEEERQARIRESKRKYRESAKGKAKQKEACKRYQQTEGFKAYKRDYYKRTKGAE